MRDREIHILVSIIYIRIYYVCKKTLKAATFGLVGGDRQTGCTYEDPSELEMELRLAARWLSGGPCMERYEDWTGGILGTTSCDRCIQLLGGTRFLLLPKPAFPSVCST